MTIHHLRPIMRVEAIDPALPAALDWVAEDPDTRECSAAMAGFVAGARYVRLDVLRWVDQARACLDDQRLDLVDQCLTEIERIAGREGT